MAIKLGHGIRDKDEERRCKKALVVYARLLPDVNRVLDRNGSTPLHAATAVDADVGLVIVDELLEQGANPNVQGAFKMTPLHMAVCMRFTTVARRLLRGGADPEVLDVDGKNAVHWARVKNCDELVRILREAGDEVAGCKGGSGSAERADVLSERT